MKIILVFLLTFSAFAAQSPASFEKLLKKEGYRAYPYDDLTGKRLSKKQLLAGEFKGTPTIGYGTVIPEKWFGHKWLYTGLSKKQARIWAQSHPVRKAVAKLISKIKTPLTQDQEDVLHEIGYNIGSSALGRIIKTLECGGTYLASQHLMQFTLSKGVKMKGLVKRRKEEAKRLRGI